MLENQRDNVVVAGYTGEMGTFLDINPGRGRSRFSRTIGFPPCGPAELVQITELIATTNQYTADGVGISWLHKHFDRRRAQHVGLRRHPREQ